MKKFIASFAASLALGIAAAALASLQGARTA